MTETEWELYMPETCPWCGGANEPLLYRSARCNNSWHRSHPEHRKMWPTWRKVRPA